MAKIGVSVKIDVSKIDKQRLYKGAKGTYLDATVFIDLGEADQYGNHGMITQDVTKEERAQQVRGAILGNAKIFYRDGVDEGQQGGQSYAAPQPQGGGDPYINDIPFARALNI
jgi:hypothetical protein